MRVLIPHLAVGRAYGLEGHTNLEVLQSSDKHANVASEGMLPVATCPWHFPVWHCHPTLPPSTEDRSAPSPSDAGAMGGFPTSSPMGRKSHPPLCISQERVKNASNPRKWPNDSSKGLCYGNVERCPLGLVAPSILLGCSVAARLDPCSRRHLLGGCQQPKPKPQVPPRWRRQVRNNEPLSGNGEIKENRKGQFNIQEWK